MNGTQKCNTNADYDAAQGASKQASKQKRSRTCSRSDPGNTVGSLHEGPGDEAGPQQAPGTIHVQLWCACWCFIEVLSRPNRRIGTLLAGFTRAPYSGSIGMDQEKHEQLQPADQFQVGRTWRKGRGGGGGRGEEGHGGSLLRRDAATNVLLLMCQIVKEAALKLYVLPHMCNVHGGY